MKNDRADAANPSTPRCMRRNPQRPTTTGSAPPRHPSRITQTSRGLALRRATPRAPHAARLTSPAAPPPLRRPGRRAGGGARPPLRRRSTPAPPAATTPTAPARRRAPARGTRGRSARCFRRSCGACSAAGASPRRPRTPTARWRRCGLAAWPCRTWRPRGRPRARSAASPAALRALAAELYNAVSSPRSTRSAHALGCCPAQHGSERKASSHSRRAALQTAASSRATASCVARYTGS